MEANLFSDDELKKSSILLMLMEPAGAAHDLKRLEQCVQAAMGQTVEPDLLEYFVAAAYRYIARLTQPMHTDEKGRMTRYHLPYIRAAREANFALSTIAGQRMLLYSTALEQIPFQEKGRAAIEDHVAYLRTLEAHAVAEYERYKLLLSQEPLVTDWYNDAPAQISARLEQAKKKRAAQL
jgi:hypothetical protein